MGNRVVIAIALIVGLSTLGQTSVSSDLDTVMSSGQMPIEGSFTLLSDWNVSTDESYANATIYLEGNLTVLASGSLTLVNSTLMLNLSENGEHWIDVYGGFNMVDLDGNPLTPDDASLMCSNESGFSYRFEAFDGSTLGLNNSIVTDCGFSSSYKGITVRTQDASFEGMDFTDNYYALSLRKDGAVVRNCTFQGNYLGVEMYLVDCVFDNNTISNSTSSGVYIYSASPVIGNSRFLSNAQGLNLRYSDAVVESCNISSSTDTGLNLYSSSPLVVNSTLSNTMDLRAVTDSFPGFLNTTLNESSISISFGLHASVGQFVDVSVKNTTGSPMNNITVSILDNGGNPASVGVTNTSGIVVGLCFRERFLTSSGSFDFGTHRVIGFSLEQGNVWYGENSTVLAADGCCEVEVDVNPSDVHVWAEYHTITGFESYSQSRIIAMDNVLVDWGGNLSVNESDIMFLSNRSASLEILCMDGSLLLADSDIYSIGTTDPLMPGRVNIQVDSGCTAELTDLELRWMVKLGISSDSVHVENVNITHSDGCGIEINGNSEPVVENVTVEWARNGINLAFGNGQVSNVSLSLIRNYGLYAGQANSAVSNLSVSGASRGVYSLSSTLDLSDLNIQSCSYGIYSMYSLLDLTNCTFQSSSRYGIYDLGGSLKMLDCEVLDGETGLWLQDSDLIHWIDSSTIEGNTYGIRADECNPVIVNSTLSNLIDITLRRATNAAVVNSTLNLNNISVMTSSYVDIGAWAYVTVLNQTLEPVNDSRVSLFDSEGRVCASDVTDANGTTGALAFRQQRILWNRTETYAPHKLMAFKTDNGSMVGENVTTLSPDENVIITVSDAGSDWIVWTNDHIVSSNESYTDKTIVAEGDVTVQDGAVLEMVDSSLWTFNDESPIVTVIDGYLNIKNATLAPISTVAPLQPGDFLLKYGEDSSGLIEDSALSNLKSIEVRSDSLTMVNSRLEQFTSSGINVQNSAPTIENVTITLCYDGIFSDSGSPIIKNSTVFENGRHGMYAISGTPNIIGTQFLYNIQGLKLTAEANAWITGCTAEENTHGFHFTDSSPFLEDSSAVHNSNNGIYCSGSYAMISGSEVSDNSYGIYCSNSAPEIGSTNITSNNYGIYIYSSGPYIENCRIDGNMYGIYNMGDAEDLEIEVFESGRGKEVATQVDGGFHDGYGIRLPKRAVLKAAGMAIEGNEVRNEPVIEDSHFQVGQTIYKDWLVWQDNKDGNWEIYAYNLSVDSNGNGVPNYMETPQLVNDPALVRITDHPNAQLNPKLWEDTIVWADLRSGNLDIYAYTASNDTEWCVLEHPATQWKPAIYGDHIAWSDERNGNYDIYMFNISGGEISRLSTSDREDLSPRMYEDKIVWYSYSGSPGGEEHSDIFLFNISQWKLTQVTNDLPIQYSPSVYKNYILWHDNRHGNWEIYQYKIGSTEERITNEVEQSFAAHMYENRIVYYFHDRVQDIWSVRMYDMSTGIQTDIEPKTNGDSHPVIYEDRIAWLNKTNGKYDVYVLNFSLIGHPYNVTVDIGCDGDNEFVWPGLFDSRDKLSASVFRSELESFLPGIGGGSMDIPINISFENTGRVGLDTLYIRYDLPTFVISSSISNSTSSGAYCFGSRPRFINSTFESNPTDVTVLSDGDPLLLNSTFSEANLSFAGKAANLTVQNFLHVKTQTVMGAPLNASIEVQDNGQVIFDKTVGDDGIVQWVVVTDARLNSTGKNENMTIVTASLGPYLFVDNPRDVDMGTSHWEVFITDPTPPEVSNIFPIPDWPYNGLDPTISVWVTDTSGVNLSTVRLYVQGYTIFYDSNPVPDGYNISYNHVPGFSDGEVVQCRIVAENVYGARVDYSWSFIINLSVQTFTVQLYTGWNLVSIPFDPPNKSIESVLGSIAGSYDTVQAYNASDSLDPWKTYSVDRPAVLNDLTELDKKMGFWIRVTENCTLWVSGTPEITAINLVAGWNLVGYPTLNDTVKMGTALWGTSADAVEGFDPAAAYHLVELPSSYIMKPGEAYWVHVPADTVWVIDW